MAKDKAGPTVEAVAQVIEGDGTGAALAPIETAAVQTQERVGLAAVVDDAALLELLGDAREAAPAFAAEDVAIPFLRVLQTLSPALKKREDTYVEGAEEGMFINTLTNELFSGETGVVVVPVAYQRQYTEWWPRDSGKEGLVKDHGTDASIMKRVTRNEAGRDVTPQGTEVVMAATFYVLVLGEDGKGVPQSDGSLAAEQAVLALTRTQLKHARKWASIIQQQRVVTSKGSAPAPLFYGAYRLTTISEKKGSNSWMSVRAAFEAPAPMLGGMELYRAGRDFAAMVARGAVKVQAPDTGLGSAEDLASEDLGEDGGDDGDTSQLPF